MVLYSSCWSQNSVYDSVCPGWSLRMWISEMFPDVAEAAGLGATP